MSAQEFLKTKHIFKNNLINYNQITDLMEEYLEKQVYPKLEIMTKCRCTVEETTGWTTVRCCNVCGKSVEDFWNVTTLKELKAETEIQQSKNAELLPSAPLATIPMLGEGG